MNPVGWFEIYVQDMRRARAFYEKTFGITLQKLEGAPIELWAFPMNGRSPGCSGALARMEEKDSGSGGTIIYFNTADCGVVAAQAQQNGGTLVNAKKPIGPHGFIAHVKDTEGNLIGLHSMT